jgi:hypothetical protein
MGDTEPPTAGGKVLWHFTIPEVRRSASAGPAEAARRRP